jgi:hypothetical protein
MHIYNDITRKFSTRTFEKFLRQNYRLFTSKKEIMIFDCCGKEMCLSRGGGEVKLMENMGYILKNRNWSTNDQIKKYHASHYKSVCQNWLT